MHLKRLPRLQKLQNNQSHGLVQKCFPPYQKNSVEWKANGPALSTLLFQVQSHAGKLKGVVDCLQTMTEKSKKENKAGYLTISAEIIHAIVDKCSHDFGLYADAALYIIETILSTDNIKLVEDTTPAFETICEKHGGSIDQNFSRYYRILSKFAQFSSHSQATDGAKISIPTGQHYRTIGLRAIRSVVKSRAIQTLERTQLDLIVPAILENLFPVEASLLHRAIREINDRDQHRRTSVNIRRSLASSRGSEARDRDIAAATSTTEDADRLGEEAVAIGAVECLKQLFEPASSSRNLLISTTAAVDSFITQTIRHNSIEKVVAWANVLFSSACTWTAVQNRYLIITEATSLLKSVKDARHGTVLASVVSTLLLSDNSFINLSVVDELRKLADILKRTTRNDEDQIALVDKLQLCITGLGNHIYYRSQIGDLVGSLLAKLREDPELSTDNRVSLLTSVRNLLEQQKKGSRAVPEASLSPKLTIGQGLADLVPMSVWDGTEKSLADEWPVQQAWASAWVSWVDSHPESPASSVRSSSPAAISLPASASTNSTGPGNGYLSGSGEFGKQKTFLDFLVLSIYDMAHSAKADDKSTRLTHVLLSSLPRLGVTGVAASLPMTVTLQEDICKVTDLIEKIRMGAIAHGYFLSVSKMFSLESTNIGQTIASEVGRRQQNGLWVRGLDVPAEEASAVGSSSRQFEGSTAAEFPSATDGTADDVLLEKVRHEVLRPFDDRKLMVGEIEGRTRLSTDARNMSLASWDRQQVARTLHHLSGSRAASLSSRKSGGRGLNGGIATFGLNGSPPGLSPSLTGPISTTVGDIQRASRLPSSHTRLSTLGGNGIGGHAHHTTAFSTAGPFLSLGTAGRSGSGASTPNLSTSSRLSLVPPGSGIGNGQKQEELRMTLMGLSGEEEGSENGPRAAGAGRERSATVEGPSTTNGGSHTTYATPPDSDAPPTLVLSEPNWADAQRAEPDVAAGIQDLLLNYAFESEDEGDDTAGEQERLRARVPDSPAEALQKPGVGKGSMQSSRPTSSMGRTFVPPY